MLHLYWEHVRYSEIIFRYGNPSTQKVEQKDYSPLFTYGKLYGSSFWLMFAMFLKWFIYIYCRIINIYQQWILMVYNLTIVG